MIDLRQLRQRQGILAQPCLDGKAGAGKAGDEPILEAGVGTAGGGVRQGIAAGVCHLLPQGLGCRVCIIAIAPIDLLALGVEGHGAMGAELLRQRGQGGGLPLVQRGAARPIARRGAVKAQGALDLHRLGKARRIIQVEIDAAGVGLPAGRERGLRERSSNSPGAAVLPGGRTDCAGDKVHPVGIDQRDDGKRDLPVQHAGRDAPERLPGGECGGVVLQECQQHQRCDPLIGMMRRRQKDPAAAAADADVGELPAVFRCADGVAGNKSVAALQGTQRGHGAGIGKHGASLLV